MANSVDPDQTGVYSGSTLFASILNSSAMLGKYLQQTTSVDDTFRCIFSWRFKAAKSVTFELLILEQMFLFFKNTVKN